MTRRQLTHVALVVKDLDASIDFYRRYAALEVVHERREPGGGRAAWMNDGQAAFVLVLLAPGRWSLRAAVTRSIARIVDTSDHLGVACASREEIVSLCRLARSEGRLRKPPRDAGPVVGFYAMISDPDGHNLEVSHGQEVGLAVARARDAGPSRS